MNTPIVQIDIENPNSLQIPEIEKLERYLVLICKQLDRSQAKLSVYIADEIEMQSINLAHRNINKSTNVLSFPFERPSGLPEEIETYFIGDIIICPSVLEREAKEQVKSSEAHWAHLFIHGILHLYDYDHVSQSDAEVMESLEINLLKQLGFHNPYDMDPI